MITVAVISLMLSYLLRQVLFAVPALFGVMVVVFALMKAVPGDAVTGLVGLEGNGGTLSHLNDAARDGGLRSAAARPPAPSRPCTPTPAPDPT